MVLDISLSLEPSREDRAGVRVKDECTSGVREVVDIKHAETNMYIAV
jgi:hypothetical protein